MNDKHISRVLNVWESKNKILNPVKQKLYFEIIDQMAHLFSAGSFYYYILNFENLKMEIVNEGTKTVLGIEPSDFTLNKLLEIMHPDDIEKMHEKESTAVKFLFQRIAKDDIPFYKVVYLFRLKHKDGTFKTILHQAKALVLSKGGKIQKVLGIHTDVTYLNMPIDDKISFIGNKRPSYFSLNGKKDIQLAKSKCKELLTDREREILFKLAKGKNSKVIAEELFISLHTINTHKKNILKKSNCKNTTELVARCIREGVI